MLQQDSRAPCRWSAGTVGYFQCTLAEGTALGSPWYTLAEGLRVAQATVALLALRVSKASGQGQGSTCAVAAGGRPCGRRHVFCDRAAVAREGRWVQGYPHSTPRTPRTPRTPGTHDARHSGTAVVLTLGIPPCWWAYQVWWAYIPLGILWAYWPVLVTCWSRADHVLVTSWSRACKSWSRAGHVLVACRSLAHCCRCWCWWGMGHHHSTSPHALQVLVLVGLLYALKTVRDDVRSRSHP